MKTRLSNLSETEEIASQKFLASTNLFEVTDLLLWGLWKGMQQSRERQASAFKLTENPSLGGLSTLCKPVRKQKLLEFLLF